MKSTAWHQKPGTVLLDTARTDRENRRSLLFTDPVEVLQIFRPSRVPELLEQLERRIQDGHYAAGYLHYECGYAFESIVDDASYDEVDQRPVAWFGIYEKPRAVSSDRLVDEAAAAAGELSIADARFSPGRSAYEERFDTIKEHIREGDVYQINFTGRVTFGYAGTPIALYQRLRSNQRVPYGAFIRTPDETILCLSPELFFRRSGRIITARPMKGTIRRGRYLEEDRELQRQLAQDEKSRAENLMIVDLLRNDLSRVSHPASVEVRSLFATETYETVTQMTSTIDARLRDDVTYLDLFRALFPCGSVTGAPKIRAMRIINRLEQARRGIYCGTIGHISPEREATFNVAIRTAVLRGNRGRMGTGSGIVWDSDADLEYDECTLKTNFLTRSGQAFYLIESMLWNGEYPLLERHLDRLERSARYFQIPFARSSVRSELVRYPARLNANHAYKIRLCLHETGRIEVEHGRVKSSDEGPWAVRFADTRIDPADRFRYHKTSHRTMLDEQHGKAAARGYDEILFLNTRGQLTEGSRSNVFVRKDGQYFTPPVACGLLPGVYRSYLLDTLSGAEEKVLYPDDLRKADDIYCCNAVRGMRSVRLQETRTSLHQP